VMKVSSHVQELMRDSVLSRHSQQRFRLRTEAGSFRNVCLFWILVAMENVLKSTGDISQRKTNLIFVWPCIIDINNKEDTQLDATITVYW
jgi:hypothetical protein